MMKLLILAKLEMMYRIISLIILSLLYHIKITQAEGQ